MYGRRNVEAEPLGLSRLVVGVLSDDDDLDPVERRAVEGFEDLAGRRIDGAVAVGRLDETGQAGEIGFFELGLQDRFPRCFDLHFHVHSLPYLRVLTRVI